MNTINASELIAAGYTFTIEDENTERSFSKSGELNGVSVEFGEVYDRYVNGCSDRERESDLKWYIEEDVENDVLADINELRDSDDRWGHVADAHVRELELMRARYLHLDVDGRDYNEYYHLAKWRYRRWLALSIYAERCSCPAKLKRMKKEVWKRYVQSIKSCAKTGEWHNLYLTKDQVNTLCDLIDVELR
jgi:hypothetical protein